MLYKQMPFSAETIAEAITELIQEKVISIDGDNLYQKRMLKDGEISLIRVEQGKKGGSSVTKQYGKEGYLYLMSDGDNLNKIGISVNPKNRLYRLRSDLKLPKHFDILDSIMVIDMGKSEDFAHAFFGDKMDGEWIKDDYKEVQVNFDLLKAKIQANNQAKIQANAESNTEYESEYKNTIPKQEELGIEFVKNTANEVWKDKIWIEQLCMANGMKLENAKDWMAQFNLSISQDVIVDFNSSRYKKMFGGWLRDKLGNGKKIVKMTDTKAQEKEMMKSIGL